MHHPLLLPRHIRYQSGASQRSPTRGNGYANRNSNGNSYLYPNIDHLTHGFWCELDPHTNHYRYGNGNTPANSNPNFYSNATPHPVTNLAATTQLNINPSTQSDLNPSTH
jgi:hypothetical protein